MSAKINIIEVTPENVDTYGVFCIKNKKAAGYAKKLTWFKDKVNDGLKIRIAIDDSEKQLGFIETIPAEKAWRPIKAVNYVFIQCIAIFSKADRSKHLGSRLLKACEAEAREDKRSGICSMTSTGVWMADHKLFEKNDYLQAAEKDRFKLMYKPFGLESKPPEFLDWKANLGKYQGWQLFYADQCPWHEKSVNDLRQAAARHNVDLQINKLTSPADILNVPSGFGTYALVHDGELLADHYISKTRFENILKKELN
ncbi:MAG: GNAT family N-acetyltransferase [Bacteroidia bacterium]|nr:GNAT family N-acetyltransferase [Bacteroidia bacterium]